MTHVFGVTFEGRHCFYLEQNNLWFLDSIRINLYCNGRGYFWRYHMGYLEFLVHFYLKNHTGLVRFSYLNFAPINLYPTINLTQPENIPWIYEKEKNYKKRDKTIYKVYFFSHTSQHLFVIHLFFKLNRLPEIWFNSKVIFILLLLRACLMLHAFSFDSLF